MSDHWRIYELTDNIELLDRDGSRVVRPQVTANCSPGLLWPGQRVGLHLGESLIGAMTVEQSAVLRALLERAEQDVLRGAAEDPPEVACG